jgi:hypothetical protein
MQLLSDSKQSPCRGRQLVHCSESGGSSICVSRRNQRLLLICRELNASFAVPASAKSLMERARSPVWGESEPSPCSSRWSAPSEVRPSAPNTPGHLRPDFARATRVHPKSNKNQTQHAYHSCHLNQGTCRTRKTMCHTLTGESLTASPLSARR